MAGIETPTYTEQSIHPVPCSRCADTGLLVRRNVNLTPSISDIWREYVPCPMPGCRKGAEMRRAWEAEATA